MCTCTDIKYSKGMLSTQHNLPAGGGGGGIGEVMGTPEVVFGGDGLGAGPMQRTKNIHAHPNVHCILSLY